MPLDLGQEVAVHIVRMKDREFLCIHRKHNQRLPLTLLSQYLYNPIRLLYDAQLHRTNATRRQPKTREQARSLVQQDQALSWSGAWRGRASTKAVRGLAHSSPRKSRRAVISVARFPAIDDPSPAAIPHSDNIVRPLTKVNDSPLHRSAEGQSI